MRLRLSNHAVRVGVAALALLVVTVLMPAPNAPAQSERGKIEAAKKRIQVLLDEAAELRERGDREAAERHQREAEQLKERLAKHLAEMKRGRREQNEERVEKILRGLEQGMAALRDLGKRDALDIMERITAQYKKELAARRRHVLQDKERAVAKEQLTIMRYALEGLIKAGHEKAADQLERAMHARRLALEGRRDDEAMHIRESAPNLGAQTELLLYAAKRLEEAGRTERAAVVRELGRKFLARYKRQRGRQENEREEVRRTLRIVRYAVDALFAANRRDAAEILEHAMHAHELELKGRRDDEAMRIRKTVPGREKIVRALRLGAEILEDRGHRERAAGVLQVARRIQGAHGREREHGEERAARRAPAQQLESALHRLELLQEKLAHYRAQIEELKQELRQLKRRL